jgi:hypothetical protein
MSRFESAGVLPTIADGVRAHSDTLRAVAVRLMIVAATTRWQSAAASAFRNRAHDAALALRVGADRLDEAAELIDRHSVAVDAARASTGGPDR